MALFQQSLWSLLRLSRLSHVLITACRELQYTVSGCAPATPSIVNYVEFRLLIQQAASVTPINTNSRVVQCLSFCFSEIKITSESNLSNHDQRKHKRGRSNFTTTFPINHIKLLIRLPSSLLIQTYLCSVNMYLLLDISTRSYRTRNAF